MVKQVLSLFLTSLISLSGVGFISTLPALSNSVNIYSVSYNQHGRVVRTSVGTFYVGRSGDAIHQAGGRRRYGYWNESNGITYIYIGDNVYSFQL
jgi:hypothetical protein